MTEEGIRQAVVDIMSEILPDEDLADIDPDKPLREQLDLDSMDFLDIVMELRKRYGIEVPESDYGKLVTMNSTVDYLLPKMTGA
ncbi:MAG: acyl carrier protein [Candidatus Nitrospinota bacterium M3_3B_026]